MSFWKLKKYWFVLRVALHKNKCSIRDIWKHSIKKIFKIKWSLTSLNYVKSFLCVISAENINNDGGLSLSPPHTVSQRETGTQVSQCYSGPPSPCGSTSSTTSPTVSPAPPPGTLTIDPNWQATKPTVRERNAAMFNNQLMADITFIVGAPGESICFLLA